MLVAQKHELSNLWVVAREGENGAIPKELAGYYTSQRAADHAIGLYTSALDITTTVKSNNHVEKELWKKAKQVKGMNSRDAFEMLRAKYYAEHSENEPS